MAIQKDVLVDGQVIKGIKFYQQTSVVAQLWKRYVKIANFGILQNNIL